MSSGTEHTLFLWDAQLCGLLKFNDTIKHSQSCWNGRCRESKQKATNEAYFHVFYGNHIPVHALLENSSLGTMFAGAERTRQLS